MGFQREALKGAEVLIESLRDAQRLSGKSAQGCSHLSRERLELISEFVENDPILRAVGAGNADLRTAIERLLERFEELCRRRDIAIQTETARKWAYRILAVELMVNAQVCEMEPGEVLSATLLNSKLVSDIFSQKEFPALDDAPSLIRDAIRHRPGRERAWLSDILVAEERLQHHPAFCTLSDSPWVFRVAASCHKEPEVFLRNVVAARMRLEADPEFEGFADAPWIYLWAAVRPDPEGILRSVQRESAEILEEQEFSLLKPRPGLVREAVARSAKNARTFLRGVLALVKEISSEQEFEQFWDYPGIITRAVISHRADPRTFLRQVANTVAEIHSEAEFADLRDTGIVLDVVSGSPTDPRGVLRRLQRTTAILKSDPETAEFAPYPTLINQAALNHPRDPKGYLRAVRDRAESLFAQAEFSVLRTWPFVVWHAAAMRTATSEQFLRAFLERARIACPEGVLPIDPAERARLFQTTFRTFKCTE